MNREKHLWIGGWGIPASIVKNLACEFFPQTEHVVMAPIQEVKTMDLSGWDRIHGYSTGSLIVMNLWQRIPSHIPVRLYAPIFGFCSEQGLGGMVRSVQLKVLLRQLKKDPLQAVNEFYQFAGLPLTLTELPYSQDDLIWGIEYLLTQMVVPEKIIGNDDRLRVFLGKNDALLDAVKIKEIAPFVTIIAQGTHDLSCLLPNAE
jgi:hypothetical protein